MTGRGLDRWMHIPAFLGLLTKSGYSPAKGSPLPGDILMCFRKGKPVHAAFFLGHGFVFEKPGQDVYEPYRLARWRAWRKDWAHTRIYVWRSKNK
jgi:hypothetical protein